MALKYLDGLFGFVIGDIMGQVSKNKTREELLKNPITKMVAEEKYNLPIGTWSDETSLTLATIDSINNKFLIDLNDIALKFSAYKNHGHYTATNEIFDMSRVTSIAIDKYDEDRTNPTNCGLDSENSNDSNSLTRMLPIAYYAIERKLKDTEIIEIVKEVSSITHANEVSIMGCYIYVRLLMFLLNDKDKLSAYSMTKCVDYSMFSEEAQNAYNRIIKEDINKYKLSDIKSEDQIVNVLEAAIWVFLKSENYREAVIGAINLGNATDAIGAITGSLAGINSGYDFIPEEWLGQVQKKDYLLDIFEEFSENKYE